MQRLLIIAAIALSLGGCAKLTSVWDSISSSHVSATTVIVAANTFDALEATATHYLELPRCPAAVVCRNPKATQSIKSAIRSGRSARDTLETFYRDPPGELGPQGVYDALQASINTLQSVFSQYKVGAQ